jgi:hypothetical protein
MVQRAGSAYTLVVTVRNSGRPIKNFCADFTDDNNSWIFRQVGMRAYDSDAFCKTLPSGTSSLKWVVIAANRGGHKMSITLGRATIYRNINNVVVDDDNALYWEDEFVIT